MEINIKIISFTKNKNKTLALLIKNLDYWCFFIMHIKNMVQSCKPVMKYLRKNHSDLSEKHPPAARKTSQILNGLSK